MNRRSFMQLMAAWGAATAADPLWPGRSLAAQPDLEVDLKAVQDREPVFPGAPTDVWRFKGKVLFGDPSQLQTLDNGWLGPIFRVHRDQRIRIRFTNLIPQESIVHWHGLHVAPKDDGHPKLAVPPGGEYIYDFQVDNRAGTYWYHPHPHGQTGNQVYGGLAGLFLVSDQEEQVLGLPAGAEDLPLVLQDRTFGPNNQLIYLRSRMERMNGFLGNRIMVNGQANRVFPVKGRAYRLRILNGSNSRMFRLGWSDGRDLQIIGTDDGLLEKPLNVPDIMLGPAERADLWADFGDMPRGTNVSLLSLPFNPGGGHMGMMRNYLVRS